MSEWQDAIDEVDAVEAVKRDRYMRSRMGVLVEQWRDSEIGQYVKKRAQQYQQRLLRELMENADFDDAKQLYALRLEYEKTRQALAWLEETVAEGHAAFVELQQIESEEIMQ